MPASKPVAPRNRHVAHERTAHNRRTVDDTLRIWFHVLLACSER